MLRNKIKSLVEEACNKVTLQEDFLSGYTYEIPKDKEKLLYDFYMSTLLFPPPTTGPSATIADPDLSYTVEDTRKRLYSALKTELLNAVFFSLSAEIRHVFVRDNFNSFKQYLTPEEQKIFKKYATEWAGYKQFQIQPDASFDDQMRELTRRSKESQSDYYYSTKAALKADPTREKIVKIYEKLYRRARWNSSYGGEAWEKIAKAWTKLNEANDIMHQMVWIDHVYDLQHNTDTVFNKLKSYTKSGGYSWIKKALDYKFKIKNPYELFKDNRISYSMRELAGYALKNWKDTTLNDWLEKNDPQWSKDTMAGKSLESMLSGKSSDGGIYKKGDLLQLSSIVTDEDIESIGFEGSGIAKLKVDTLKFEKDISAEEVQKFYTMKGVENFPEAKWLVALKGASELEVALPYAFVKKKKDKTDLKDEFEIGDKVKPNPDQIGNGFFYEPNITRNSIGIVKKYEIKDKGKYYTVEFDDLHGANGGVQYGYFDDFIKIDDEDTTPDTSTTKVYDFKVGDKVKLKPDYNDKKSLAKIDITGDNTKIVLDEIGVVRSLAGNNFYLAKGWKTINIHWTKQGEYQHYSIPKNWLMPAEEESEPKDNPEDTDDPTEKKLMTYEDFKDIPIGSVLIYKSSDAHLNDSLVKLIRKDNDSITYKYGSYFNTKKEHLATSSVKKPFSLMHDNLYYQLVSENAPLAYEDEEGNKIKKGDFVKLSDKISDKSDSTGISLAKMAIDKGIFPDKVYEVKKLTLDGSNVMIWVKGEKGLDYFGTGWWKKADKEDKVDTSSEYKVSDHPLFKVEDTVKLSPLATDKALDGIGVVASLKMLKDASENGELTIQYVQKETEPKAQYGGIMDFWYKVQPTGYALPQRFLEPLQHEPLSEGYLGGSYDYELPKDKEQMLYDFYLSTLLFPPPTEGPSAVIRPGATEELSQAVERAKTRLYESLKKELLDAVFYSLTAEIRHFFDSDRMSNAANILTPEEYKIFEKYAKNMAAYGSFNIEPTKRAEYNRRLIKNSSEEYTKSFKSALNADPSKKTFVELMEKLYQKGKWRSSYGGPAWANIAKAWLNLDSAQDNLKKMIWIDHVYDLQHNTDTVFNKIKNYTKGGNYRWLKTALDYKFKIKSPWQLWDKISQSMKDLAAPAFKAWKGETLEDYIKTNAAELAQPDRDVSELPSQKLSSQMNVDPSKVEGNRQIWKENWSKLKVGDDFTVVGGTKEYLASFHSTINLTGKIIAIRGGEKSNSASWKMIVEYDKSKFNSAAYSTHGQKNIVDWSLNEINSKKILVKGINAQLSPSSSTTIDKAGDLDLENIKSSDYTPLVEADLKLLKKGDILISNSNVAGPEYEGFVGEFVRWTDNTITCKVIKNSPKLQHYSGSRLTLKYYKWSFVKTGSSESTSSSQKQNLKFKVGDMVKVTDKTPHSVLGYGHIGKIGTIKRIKMDDYPKYYLVFHGQSKSVPFGVEYSDKGALEPITKNEKIVDSINYSDLEIGLIVKMEDGKFAKVASYKEEPLAGNETIVTLVDPKTGEHITDNFGYDDLVKATPEEIKKLKSDSDKVQFNIGDKVKIKNDVTVKDLERISIWHSGQAVIDKGTGVIVDTVFIGNVRIDFGEAGIWWLKPQWLEKVETAKEEKKFKIGDKVKIKDSVKPEDLAKDAITHSAQKVINDKYGTVTSTTVENVQVQFKHVGSWWLGVEFLEIDTGDKDPEKSGHSEVDEKDPKKNPGLFKKGDNVIVKPDVKPEDVEDVDEKELDVAKKDVGILDHYQDDWTTEYGVWWVKFSEIEDALPFQTSQITFVGKDEKDKEHKDKLKVGDKVKYAFPKHGHPSYQAYEGKIATVEGFVIGTETVKIKFDETAPNTENPMTTVKTNLTKVSNLQEDLDDPKKNWKSWKNPPFKDAATSGRKAAEKAIKRWNDLATGKTPDANFTPSNREPLKQLKEIKDLDEYITTMDEAIVTKYEMTSGKDRKKISRLNKKKVSNVVGRRVENGCAGTLSERRMLLKERFRRGIKAIKGNHKAKARGKLRMGKTHKIINAKMNPFAK